MRATQFRRWATGVLRTFTIQGYVLDKERMKNGSFINQDYLTSCFKALSKFEKYRVKQDRLYKSDFDLLLEETKKMG